MKRFRMLFKYIVHYFTARHTRGFGVHSPFVFHFIKFVINNKSSYYIFPSIEKIRASLKEDSRRLNIVDFGTGSDRSKTIAEIASKSLSGTKYGQLLFRLTESIKARNVLELGTSLGISTSYLASSSSEIRCVSLEGSQMIADIACENFKQLNIKNIKIVVGNIDKTLGEVLNEFEQLDLVFIDANHRSKAVLSYFEQCLMKVHDDSVIVVDDIYWSNDMEKAWKIIKEHPRVTATIDLFQMGIVFFNSDLHKKHYKMVY